MFKSRGRKNIKDDISSSSASDQDNKTENNDHTLLKSHLTKWVATFEPEIGPDVKI